MGVLILLAGVEMFTGTALFGMTGLQLAGLLLIVFGLLKLAHVCGMCGSCGTCCVEGKKK